MPCSDALPGMTDHQGHASPRKLPHRLPTAYAPAPAPEDMVKFNLERCNLALLHQQKTGRLFIVLFEKKKKLLSEVFQGLQIVNECTGAEWSTRIARNDMIKLLFKNNPEKPPEIEELGEEGVGTVQMCVGVSADPFAVRNYYPPRGRFLTWA
ncbi:hypothetical protein quinque_015084 [Culex quinquefasciatus]